jgi:hypothetical protein
LQVVEQECPQHNLEVQEQEVLVVVVTELQTLRQVDPLEQ